jgi:hypothetical protein
MTEPISFDAATKYLAELLDGRLALTHAQMQRAYCLAH